MAIKDAHGLCSIVFDLAARGVKLTKVLSAVAISSTKIRLTFDGPMANDYDLVWHGNYDVYPSTPGAINPTVLSVEAESATYPTYVDITISETTDSATYTAEANPDAITDYIGDPLDPDINSANFTGIGVAPTIESIASIGENRANVIFSENMKDNAAIHDASNYSFDGGLSVLSVLSVESKTVMLSTTDQTSGQNYTLTITTGVLYDLAKNALAAPNNTGNMIGYVEPIATEETLSLDMYKFILEPIRQADETREGALFLKRFLQGPQELWRQTIAKAFALRDLHSSVLCPDEYLVYLKNHVGWTEDLNYITERLSYPVLRKLIDASPEIWKNRGREETMANIITLATGAECMIWNWFDYRWSLGESVFGEYRDGLDPWLINLPGSEDYEEYTSTLRVVDNGELDRDLLLYLVKFMRAISERFEVAYINFFDKFSIDNDYIQWSPTPSDATITVSGGFCEITNTSAQFFVINNDYSLDWARYVYYSKIMGDGVFGPVAYYTDDDNMYRLEFTAETTQYSLKKIKAGTPTVLTSGNLPFIVHEDVWTAVRMHVEPPSVGSTQIRIKIYVGTVLYIDVLDTSNVLSGGTAGVYCEANKVVKIDEAELFELPLETDYVDINS